jgi:hypothetical protein
VVAKVRDRLAVSKQTTHRVHMERFNLKKINKVEDRGQYRVEISKTMRWILIALGKLSQRTSKFQLKGVYAIKN